MNLLEELTTIITNHNIPVETGIFTDIAPDTYAVLVPMSDVFVMHADDTPQYETQEVRISLYSKTNYLTLTAQLTRTIQNAGITVSARTNVGYEPDTQYHHMSIDTKKGYKWEV